MVKGMEQTKSKFLQLKQEVVLEESSEVTMLLPQGEVWASPQAVPEGEVLLPSG